MAKITLTSRDAEKKQNLISLELVLLFVLGFAVFAVVATLGSDVIGQSDAKSSAFEAELDGLTDAF
jgi:hypothetical protein